MAGRTGSDALGDKIRESWGAMLKPASFRGRLCFAPNSGQSVRFTRPDRWLDGVAPVEPEVGLAEVTRRYLAAYGPATREDYARWWGVMPARAGALLAALGDEVTKVEVEGVTGFVLAADLAQLGDGARSVRLLPAFDPWVIGASRAVPELLAGDFRDRVYRPQGWISAVLLVHGRMDGVWRHERARGRVAVQIEPFVSLKAKVRKAAEQEAERLAAFFGDPLELSWAE